MKRIFFLMFCLLLNEYGQSQDLNTLTDKRDGNIYKICSIGTQIWIAENLRYKATGAVGYNNSENNIGLFGYLYDWKLANKVCPDGWHLPDEKDWATLNSFLGGKNISGGKMKSVEKTLWNEPNRFANNSSKFSAIPSGALIDGEFKFLHEASYFWSSEAECTSAFVLYLTFNAGFADRKTLLKTDKAAVRCVKD